LSNEGHTGSVNGISGGEGSQSLEKSKMQLDVETPWSRQAGHIALLPTIDMSFIKVSSSGKFSALYFILQKFELCASIS